MPKGEKMKTADSIIHIILWAVIIITAIEWIQYYIKKGKLENEEKKENKQISKTDDNT